jgi:epoxyqueuosine reductase
MSLARRVKEEALRLGFDLAGITTPDPPPHWLAFQNWLAMGRHASMKYLEDPRRADPRLLLPECKSILVLAMRYAHPRSVGLQGGQPHRGRLAAYAWGRDYHLVLPEKLQALADFVQREAGVPVPYRFYTDAGPLLERDLAQRAGLGWVGKNTCLIHPQLGSFFFLAELLLGIELEPDPPFLADRCGTCTRCIEACPTGCILPDRTLDARRCLSYLTIENKGSIPPELRPQVGNWIFGCDICQMVCPWNRRARPDPDPDFAPRPGLPAPDLLEELSLTRQQFNQKFKESPVQRARWRGYLRNVMVAVGNAALPEASSLLLQYAAGEDEMLAEHAAWALSQITSQFSKKAHP